jgi:ABC-type antimicrobial peptide transport system permease subunit
MTFSRLLLRNLFYHWRGNLAVCLGVVVGTAVLTGALLVGDSLRGSLRDLTLKRLGWIDEALVTGRFFRTTLAKPLPADRATPAIVLQGAATFHPGEDPKQLRRVSGITVLGVEEQFWADGQIPVGVDFWHSTKPEVVVNSALARELGIKTGDRITLHFQKASSVPRETLLGRREADDVLQDLTVTVRQVLSDDGLAGFSLSPSPQTARNAFVPLGLLQSRLDKNDRANALFAGGVRKPLEDALHHALTLDDWNLALQTPKERAEHDFKLLGPRAQWAERVPEELVPKARSRTLSAQDLISYYESHHPFLNLQSRQMYLEPATVTAAGRAAEANGWEAAPTLIYLADRIRNGPSSISYAVVAALDVHKEPPLGPFLPPEPPTRHTPHLDENEIVLANWKESPLQAKAGDNVTLEYYDPDPQGKLELRSKEFRVRGLLPLRGPADDPDLTPEFPGITDKLDMASWTNPPFPYDPRRVTPADEQYWKRYRTTPKAYVSLKTGQALWGSRFGQLTSIRLANKAGVTPETASKYQTTLLDRLRPEAGGFAFNNLRAQGLAASSGGTDFGMLFLAFSIFLIVAALLLVGLLFRLNLDRRASEIGVLLATGFRRATVRRLLLGEGAILAAVGGVLGCAAGVLYAWLLLDFLACRWPGGLEQSFLRLHVTAQSFVIGYVTAFLVSVLTIIWALRMLRRIEPTALLAGQTTTPPTTTTGRLSWSVWIVALGSLGAGATLVVGALAQGHEAKAGSFFTSGFLLLTVCLAGVWIWMRSRRHRRIEGQGMPAVARLGVRNGTRNPLRSLLTVGLLGAATFLVIAVQSFHREPGHDFLDRKGGSGGFALVADADVPIYQDLNTSAGRDQLNLTTQAQQTLGNTRFYSFRVHQGDDASCLNLYQARSPRLFGVPHTLVERGGFQFAATEAQTPEERANPWLLLEKPQTDGAIPVFGENNTVTWQLNSGLGRELIVSNERGDKVHLRIVGLLEDSVFQGELLMSDGNFLRLYPRQEGFQVFLIEVPAEQTKEIRETLETSLADHGFTVTPSAQRVAAFLAVENTYLLTFQALGGLALVLGSLGLAIVLLRGVWERRGELALLRALGFRRRVLGWLVLAETLWLLILGLGAGTLAALVSTAPFLTAGSGALVWPWLAGLLGLVFVVGLGAGAAALATALRAPLLPALRRE